MEEERKVNIVELIKDWPVYRIFVLCSLYGTKRFTKNASKFSVITHLLESVDLQDDSVYNRFLDSIENLKEY